MVSRGLLLAISLTIAARAVPTARTVNGTYTGISVPSLAQNNFLGIPFAQQRRFELATPYNETWNGTRNATSPGLTCAGYGTNPRENWPIGEDCLNLNIVRPDDAYEGLDLPVLVWMYGGGYRQGSNRDPEFNTSFLVQASVEIGHPIIIVAGNGALNIGLHDQRQALRWVQENIRGFGGDPHRVTIWGESAGASSVALQILAYGGDNQGLFRGAIMASGSFFGFGQRSLAEGQTVYDNITTNTGCSDAIDTLQCLKNLPFQQINTTVFDQDQGQSFGPVFDGDFFRTYPFLAFEAGRVSPVNIITGCNSDEGMSLGGQTSANTSAELAVYLQQGLGVSNRLVQELMDLYPLDAPAPPYSIPLDYPWQNATAEVGLYSGNQTRRSYAIFGDKAVMAGRRKTASEWSKFGGQAYSFRWDTDPSRFPIVYSPGLGPGFAQHGAELSWEFRLPYVSSTPYPPLPNITAMRQVSYAMQATWASFTATGSPNHHGLYWVPYWPSYANGSENMVFNGTLSNVLNLHIEKDNFRSAGIAWMNERWSLLDA